MSRASNLAGFSTSIQSVAPNNLVVGVITATSFVGSITGTASTASFATTSFGLSGSPNITIGNLTGVAATFSGNVSIAGTLTYEDVTNVDSVGLVTARTGVRVDAGGLVVTAGVSTFSALVNAGGINATGVITATSFSGDGSALTGVGIGSTGNISTTGNINAGIATFTRLDVPPVPITFSPGIGVTNVNVDSNIIITFNQLITKGTGNITLRSGSAGGTAFSTIGVSSSSVTISGGAVTIDPPENIGTGVTTFVVVDAGAFSGLTTTSVNALINTYSFKTTDFALTSINPANGATNVGIDTNITLTFSGPPTRGTGTITLRSGSTSGSVIETFNAASSDRISISGNNWILDPTSNLGFTTSIHTIIPSTAIQNYVGLNTTGADTHSFTTDSPALGSSYEGGFLICKASPLRWVVSPYSAEVSTNWYSRNDANTTAQQVSGCTGWFVPTIGQLQNPGYDCRSFWGPSPCYSPASYWSSSESNLVTQAWRICFDGFGIYNFKNCTNCVRAFRCVTY